jgi:hypothetical protein
MSEFVLRAGLADETPKTFARDSAAEGGHASTMIRPDMRYTLSCVKPEYSSFFRRFLTSLSSKKRLFPRFKAISL